MLMKRRWFQYGINQYLAFETTTGKYPVHLLQTSPFCITRAKSTLINHSLLTWLTPLAIFTH